MTAQFDLFGVAKSALPPGLPYRKDILSAGEEAALLKKLADVAVAPFRFQGWTGKRETASIGWHYDFDSAKLGAAAPIPEFLLP